MKNKICIVTGGNSGIGKVTAKALAELGAKVIIVCRNREKGIATLQDIRETSGNPHVELLIADLSQQKEVEKLASGIQLRYPQIDILVNNAGMIADVRTETNEGIETTIATNHLSVFFLTNLLLANKKFVTGSRIIVLASDAARMGKIDLDDINLTEGFTPWKAYSQSKLANILFTFELSRKLKGTGITANCVHPGMVKTNFGSDLTGISHFLFSLAGPFMRTPEKGAETVIWLASSPQVEGISGKFFHDKKEIKAPPLAYDIKLAKQLWELSEQMTTVKYGSVGS